MEERWFDKELAGCRLGDGRLDRRLRQLVERMEVGFGVPSGNLVKFGQVTDRFIPADAVQEAPSD